MSPCFDPEFVETPQPFLQLGAALAAERHMIEADAKLR
jgi:hypothetical protein